MSASLRRAVEDVWHAELRGAHAWSVMISVDASRLVSHRADLAYSGASMIKTFVALSLVRRVAAGDTRWDGPCAVTAEMRALGDGVLGGFGLPTSQAIADVCHLMLAVSDNAATSALAEALGGLVAVNDELRAAGFRSRLRRWAGSARVDHRAEQWTADASLTNAAGLSVVVPAEHARVMRMIMDGYGPHSGRVSAMLHAQHDRRALARFVAADAAFAHKTATVDGVRHDGGMLTLPDGGRLEVGSGRFSCYPPMSERFTCPVCGYPEPDRAASKRRLRWLVRDLLAVRLRVRSHRR